MYHCMPNPYKTPISREPVTPAPGKSAMWDHVKERIRKDPQHSMFRRLFARHEMPYSRREFAIWKWVYTFEKHRDENNIYGEKLGGPLIDVWAEGDSGTTGDQ